MTECSCLSQKIVVRVYESRPWKLWEKLFLIGDRYIKGTTITIYGETMEEIDRKLKIFEDEYTKDLKDIRCFSYSI